MLAGPATGAARTRPLRLAATLLVAALALCWATSGDAPAQSVATAKAKAPNLILIQIDDATAEMVSPQTMPRTFHRLAGNGTILDNYVATTPLCCPSRASLLTGQYAHNHGVLDNQPGFPDLVAKDNILPAWLQNAGYKTAHVGKYLNNSVGNTPTRPPKAWDRWSVALEPNRYYRYGLQVGKGEKQYATGRHDYLTTVLNGQADKIVKHFAPKRDPFFLEVDQFAPHKDRGIPGGGCRHAAVPGPRDEHRFDSAPLPTPPSFDEGNVSDKSSFMQFYDPISQHGVDKITHRYRCALGSLREVDRGVEQIHDALDRTHSLDDTVIALTSDNGFFYGEHRIQQGKEIAYEEILHMPFMISVPHRYLPGGGGPVGHVNQMTANVDIAPTFLDLAGAKPCPRHGNCRTMDGRSFLSLLAGQNGSWPDDRGVALEFAVHRDRRTPSRPCKFEGIRTETDTYVEYRLLPRVDAPHLCEPSDEAEYYDLTDDPFELQNTYPAGGGGLAARQADLADRVKSLQRCEGIQGRDPQPRHGHDYCE